MELTSFQRRSTLRRAQVPADWPYFGAVDFEDVTVRHRPTVAKSEVLGSRPDYCLHMFARQTCTSF